MSEGLEIQLKIATDQARKQVQEFVRTAQSELRGGFSGSRGGKKSDTFTAGMKEAVRREKQLQTEREHNLRQGAQSRKKLELGVIRETMKAWRQARRQADRQQAQDEQKAQERRRKALHEELAERAKIARKMRQGEHRPGMKGRESITALLARDKAVGMAADPSVPIEEVRRQEEKATRIITAEAKKRFEAISRSERAAVALRNEAAAAAEQAAKREKKANEEAANASQAAWNKEAAERKRIAAEARATGRGNNPGHRVRVSAQRDAVLAAANDPKVPIEKVREQQKKLTNIVAAGSKDRLRVIRESEERAIAARKLASSEVLDISRVRDAKLRAAAVKLRDQILAAANSGNAQRIAQAERLKGSLVKIKKQQAQSIIQTIINQEEAAGKISKKRAAEIAGNQNHLAKQSGRGALYLFQFQQAAEDAAAALSTGQGLSGVLRSSSNNLALIASLMSGPGGAIALTGLMAVSVGSLVASLVKLTNSTKKQNESAKEQNELLREELRIRLQLAGETAKAAEEAARGAGKFGESAGASEGRDAIRTAMRDIMKGGGIDALVRDVAAVIRKQAKEALTEQPFGGPPKRLGDVLKASDESGRLATLKQELALQKDVLTVERDRIRSAKLFMSERQKLLDLMSAIRPDDTGRLTQEQLEQMAALKERMVALRSEFSKKSPEAFRGLFPQGGFSPDAAKQHIAESEKGLQEEMRNLRQQESLLEAMVRNIAENAEAKAKGLLVEAQSSDEAANILALVLEQNKEIQAQLKFRERLAELGKAEEAANRQLMTDAERRKSDAEKELAKANEHLEAEKDRVAAIQDAQKKEAELAAAVRQHQEAVEKHRRVLEEINLLEAQQREIKREQLDLEREKLREQDQRLKNNEREIEQAIELMKRLKAAKQSSRDSFETSAFGTVRNRTQDMVAHQAQVAKSKLSPFLPPEVRDFYSQIIDQQAMQFGKAKDDALLEMRGKFLTDQAAAAGAAGDTDRQRKLLQELQGLQLGVANSDPNLARAKAAFEAAKKTQQQIEATFEKESNAAQARIDQLTGSNTKLRGAIDRLRTAIENLERAERGLPPKEEEPKPPVEAPKPPKPPKPPEPEKRPPEPKQRKKKPPVDPKPPNLPPGEDLRPLDLPPAGAPPKPPNPPVQAQKPPKFDPMNPQWDAWKALPKAKQDEYLAGFADHKDRMLASGRHKDHLGVGSWGVQLEDGAPWRERQAHHQQYDDLMKRDPKELKRLQDRARKNLPFQHALNRRQDERDTWERRSKSSDLRRELEEGRKQLGEWKEKSESREHDDAMRRQEAERRRKFFDEKRRGPMPPDKPLEVSDAFDGMGKKLRELVADMDDPLKVDPEGPAGAASQRDPAMAAIRQNTQQTEREVAQHSAKTDTTNSLLRELIGATRQAASQPPTVIVAGGGGGGGFPVPSFPSPSPAPAPTGGRSFGMGGFGGPAAFSQVSSNTFGSVAINVNSQQEAGSLFREFSLARTASNMRAGR